MAGNVEEMFFAEDTVTLKRDPSFVAVVEQTWRDTESVAALVADDWIPHRGISKLAYKEFRRESLPPKGHVIIRFLEPHVGCTLIKETDLILRDRGLVVGDVVKRNPSDVESGYVVKTSIKCTLQPIYTDLPWTIGQPWPHKAEENRIQVPSEELTFTDMNPGDYVMYQGWVGEVSDIYEELLVKLEDGSVVHVRDAEEVDGVLYMPPTVKYRNQSLVKYLQSARADLATRDPTHKGPCEVYYPGQYIFTKKSNLRLGHWVIGSYSPNVKPQGVVVEVRTTQVAVDWFTKNLFNPEHARNPVPPDILTSDTFDQLKLYNRNNITSQTNGTSNQYGSRQGHDIGAADIVRFRDITTAAVKYSEDSGQVASTGRFRRIPRASTFGYDMNTFTVLDTSQTVAVQWQSGEYSDEIATSLIPYLQVDDHDVWVGETVSLKSAERRNETPCIFLGKIGVVQSVNARERLATIRWYEGNVVSILQRTPQVLLPGCSLGTLSETTEQVSVYEIVAYPALTKRRGDLVIISPNEDIQAMEQARALDNLSNRVTEQPITDLIEDAMGPVSREWEEGLPGADPDLRWFGEVVDLGLDGLLTVRLGGLEKVQDIRLPVTRVGVVVSGDDDDEGENATAFTDDEYESYDTGSEDLDEADIEEIISYEGGQRLDDGDSEDWTDDDGEESDGDGHTTDEESFHEDGDTKMVDAQPPEVTPSTNKSERREEYHFSSHSSMPAKFEILDEPPAPDHHFLTTQPGLTGSLLRRIQKEHSILKDSLPEGIWVRSWHERPDILRILIVGPRNTPYELAPFVLDLQFGDDFPRNPPKVFFHSWTYGVGRINPNLYEDGKVCLSVLGTWPEGNRREGWEKDKSSVLQVLVSLMGLVLVAEPFYNEAGFENLVNAEETHMPSRMYSEKAWCMSKGFIAHALRNDMPAIKPIVEWLYLEKKGPSLLKLAVEESKAKQAKGKTGDDGERLSAGADVLLTKHLKYLEERLKSG